MKKFIVLNALVLLVAISFNSSYATVLVEDVDASFVVNNVPFTEGTIPTGEGSPGDYSLIGCATQQLQPLNSFNPPAPGLWTELDNGTCGGVGQCIQGIWGKFLDTPDSEDITCSWNDPQFVFAAGSFRYSDVDKENPIIEVACNSGTGSIATAPSITTEAFSQVARIYTGSQLFAEMGAINNVESFPAGIFLGIAALNGFTVFIQGDTVLTEDAGETGEATLDLTMVGAPFIEPIDFSPAAWRACTVGLRMAPVIRNVPTMSEWGMIAFAAFAGVAGIWFLRRRQAANA